MNGTTSTYWRQSDGRTRVSAPSVFAHFQSLVAGSPPRCRRSTEYAAGHGCENHGEATDPYHRFGNIYKLSVFLLILAHIVRSSNDHPKIRTGIEQSRKIAGFVRKQVVFDAYRCFHRSLLGWSRSHETKPGQSTHPRRTGQCPLALRGCPRSNRNRRGTPEPERERHRHSVGPTTIAGS